MQELVVAMQGKEIDPNAGSWKIEPVFDQTSFKMDYLTKPSGIQAFRECKSFATTDKTMQDDIWCQYLLYKLELRRIAVEWTSFSDSSEKDQISFRIPSKKSDQIFSPSPFGPKGLEAFFWQVHKALHVLESLLSWPAEKPDQAPSLLCFGGMMLGVLYPLCGYSNNAVDL